MPSPSPSITVTGKLETIAGGNDPGHVVITLVGFNGNPPRISGTMLVSDIIQTVQAADDGTFSVNLWGNYQLIPSGTAYQVAIYPSSSDTAPTVVAEYIFSTAGTYDLSATAPNTTYIQPARPVVGNVASVFGRTGIVTAQTADYAFSQLSGSLDNVRWAINFPGSDIGAKINAAASDLGSVYGTIYVSPGTYTYSTDIVLPNPVRLLLDTGAVLNYTGSGKAAKIGPDGLTDLTYDPHPYIVEGGTFTGGASMTHGLYFNKLLVSIRVVGTFFLDFGNTTAYNIFCQSGNWDTRIDRVTMWGTPSGPCFNGICLNGYDSDNVTSDFGNSFIRVVDCLIQRMNQTTPTTGVLLDGFQSVVETTTVAGFNPNVRFRKWANESIVRNVYTEMTDTASGALSFSFGDISADPGATIGAFLDGLTFRDCYVNVHNTDGIATTAHCIGPATSSAGLQNSVLDSFTAGAITGGEPVVVLNNKTSQVGNVANYTRYSTSGVPFSFGAMTLNTTGSHITPWGGSDGSADTISNNFDGPNFLNVQAGKTAHQTAGVQFLDYQGSPIGDIECTEVGNTSIVRNGLVGVAVNSSGDAVLGSGNVTVDHAGAINIAAGGSLAGNFTGSPTFDTGTSSFTDKLVIPTHTPSSASDTGTAGQIAWDSSYIYICTATNTWKRVAISTW